MGDPGFRGLWNPWLQLPLYTQVNLFICRLLVSGLSQQMHCVERLRCGGKIQEGIYAEYRMQNAERRMQNAGKSDENLSRRCAASSRTHARSINLPKIQSWDGPRCQAEKEGTVESLVPWTVVGRPTDGHRTAGRRRCPCRQRRPCRQL